MLCLATKGAWACTISSSPKFAWKLVSMSAKMAIDPSAPPPLYNDISRPKQMRQLKQGQRNEPKLARGIKGRRETDSVMEGETE